MNQEYASTKVVLTKIHANLDCLVEEAFVSYLNALAHIIVHPILNVFKEDVHQEIRSALMIHIVTRKSFVMEKMNAWQTLVIMMIIVHLDLQDVFNMFVQIHAKIVQVQIPLLPNYLE